MRTWRSNLCNMRYAHLVYALQHKCIALAQNQGLHLKTDLISDYRFQWILISAKGEGRRKKQVGRHEK